MPNIKLLDTLSRKKKFLKKEDKKPLRLFVCGPTVYDYAHIGHARTYVAFDALVKYLRAAGLKIKYIQNITDVDDKIINRAKKEKITATRLARWFEKEYHKDMRALGVDAVDFYAQASDYIPQIIEQIQLLIMKENAYQTRSGVYFDINTFPDYGKLSHQNLKQLRKNVRIEKDPHKKNDFDFALWKNVKEKPFWDSPWGKGRPGWHIEDTAITEHHFGPQYDLHGGAYDLVFPHHESEIAQQEAASGLKPMVQIWLHTGFLTTGGEKMSKSLGNFVTVRELLKKYSPQTFRLFTLTKHYRSPVDYTEDGLREADTQRLRLEEFLRKLKGYIHERKGGNGDNGGNRIKGINGDNGSNSSPFSLFSLLSPFVPFWRALEDDFNTPKAFGAMFTLLRKMNQKIDQRTLKIAEASSIEKFMKQINTIFNIYDSSNVERATPIPPEIKKLLARREELRKQKKWQEADKLRREIQKFGYEVQDTPEGPKVTTKVLQPKSRTRKP